MSAPFLLAALDLDDRACVVFGCGAEALRRARTLREHGARVSIVGPEPSAELSSWSAASGDVALEVREPRTADLDGVWLAVLADQNAAWAALLGPEAELRRLFFCAVDQPEHNSFAHVGVAQAGALQLGISTSGRVPGIAGALRSLLQRLLDEGQFEKVVERIEEVRATSPLAERSGRVRRLAARLRLEGRLFLEDE